MFGVLAILSLFIPQDFLSRRFIQRRTEYFLKSPTDCDHEWWVVASIANTGELQVQCFKCGHYSEASDPTDEEWNASYGAMENPYIWEALDRVNPVR